MARQSQKRGSDGEQLVLNRLHALGVNKPRKIPTEIVLQRVPNHLVKTDRPAYFVAWKKKALGDIWGVLPNGIAVLCEVKTYLDGDRLQYSKLSDHQPKNLNDHYQSNGLALLAWVNYSGVHICKWPIPGFVPRTSLSIDQAIENEWSGYHERHISR